MELSGALNYWHWSIIGLALLIIEVLSFTAILLWVGAAAFVTALFNYLSPQSSWEIQCLCFTLTTLLLLALSRLFLHRQKPRADQPTLNRRADNLVGQIHRLPEGIVDGTGQLNISDTLWNVRGPDLPANCTIEIIAVEGSVLQVVKYSP